MVRSWLRLHRPRRLRPAARPQHDPRRPRRLILLRPPRQSQDRRKIRRRKPVPHLPGPVETVRPLLQIAPTGRPESVLQIPWRILTFQAPSHHPIRANHRLQSVQISFVIRRQSRHSDRWTKLTPGKNLV